MIQLLRRHISEIPAQSLLSLQDKNGNLSEYPVIKLATVAPCPSCQLVTGGIDCMDCSHALDGQSQLEQLTRLY